MFQNPFDESSMWRDMNPYGRDSFGWQDESPAGRSWGAPDGWRPGGPPPNFMPVMETRGGQPGGQTGSRGIRQCMYRNTFVWLRNGESFWFIPTFVSRWTILGFRWGRFGWMFHTLNRNQIISFRCF